MFFVPSVPLRIQKWRICLNTWRWPVTGRGLCWKSEVWGTLPCLRLVGPHQRTTPSSAPVTGTLKVTHPHKITFYLNVMVEHTDTGTLNHHINVNCMQAQRKKERQNFTLKQRGQNAMYKVKN